MKSHEVLARLRQQGYTGGKTAVYDLVRQLRPPKPVVPLVRFEGLPGEFSQYDFGQRRVRYADGSTEVAGKVLPLDALQGKDFGHFQRQPVAQA
jgi:hypothetical protein